MKKKAYNKNKIPLPLRVINWLFPKVEKVSQPLANWWFYRIFFSTAKYPVPEPEKQLQGKAKKYKIDYKGLKIQVYEWGEGTPVFMIHGWMGRGTQFREMIKSFVEEGFKVVTVDASGHGNSDGKSSHIWEFVEIIELVQSKYDPFEALIGHSLGGVACLHVAIRNNYHKLAMIGSPAIAKLILDEFRYRIKAGPAVLDYFNTRFVRDHGRSFESYSAVANVKNLKEAELFLIHDKYDQEVPVKNALAMKEGYPEAELCVTEGLGHTRILRDAGVIEKTIDFVKNRSKASKVA